jgi:hypothetical protein
LREFYALNEHRSKAEGKPISGITDALGPVIFQFMYMYKP